MKAAIIIPARYGSMRLPGKPLLAETGKPLIQHTYEQAAKSARASSVIVATDDMRIHDAVRGFGGAAMMTSPAHDTGSARAAETAEAVDADIIVNLQGDEPEIDPGDLDHLIDIQARGQSFASTLVCRFPKWAAEGPGSPDDPSAVKAVLGRELGGGARRALYFTRSICPYPRDNHDRIAAPENYFLHVGVYAFTKASLAAFAAAPAGALEKIERLEQLRILEMGEVIAAGVIGQAAPGIDTPEDYREFVARMAKRD